MKKYYCKIDNGTLGEEEVENITITTRRGGKGRRYSIRLFPEDVQNIEIICLEKKEKSEKKRKKLPDYICNLPRCQSCQMYRLYHGFGIKNRTKKI